MKKSPIRRVSIYNIDAAVDVAVNRLEMARPTLPSQRLAFEKEITRVARHMMRAIVTFLTKSHGIPSQLDCPRELIEYSAIMFAEDLNERQKNPYDSKITELCSKLLYDTKYGFIQDIVDEYNRLKLQDTPVTLLHYGNNLVVIYHRPAIETDI